MKRFDFSKEFGNIDPKYISEAEGEWKGKKKAWAPSFWSKLAAACVILALISTVLSNPKVQAAIKNLALSIGETLGFQKEIEPYTEALNISQTDHGITANIKEVVLDEGVLLFRVHAEIDNTEENEKKKTANISSFRNTGITLDMGKTTSGSSVGTGGMATKLIAARIATSSGADMVIANGNNIDNITGIMAGEDVGTLFVSDKKQNFDLVGLID